MGPQCLILSPAPWSSTQKVAEFLMTAKDGNSHTNKELELMLTAGKPLAVFCKFVGEDIDETGGQDFESAVNRGFILKKKFYVSRRRYKKRLLYTAYALPGQEWRVEIYKVLMKEMENNWNSELEYLQGFLLGYESKIKAVSR